MDSSINNNKIKSFILSVIPFILAYIGLLLIYEPLIKAELIVPIFFIIFGLVIIGVIVYALIHKTPVWTSVWLGFAILIPFVLLYAIDLHTRGSLLFLFGLITLLVGVLIVSYMLTKNSRSWFLFSLPLLIIWGVFMCDEIHPTVVILVQTLIILFCIIAVFLLIYTQFRWHLSVLITGMVLYTAIYFYLIFYAPFVPGSPLSLTYKNSYVGIIPTLVGYFVPGIIILSGPAVAHLQMRFARKYP